MKIHQWRNWFFFFIYFSLIRFSLIFYEYFIYILWLRTESRAGLKLYVIMTFVWFDCSNIIAVFFFDFFCTFLNVTGIDHALDYHRYYLSWITFDYVRLCSIVLHLMEEQTYKQQQNIHELQYKPRGVKVIRVRYLFQPSQ